MFRDFHLRKISWRVSVPSDAGNLAFDAGETVYVAHWNGNKIAAYRAGGTLLREWGTQGTADGEFRLPGSIALGPGGLPYVPDLGGQSPPELHTNGKFVSKWSELGTRHGQVGKGQPAGSRFAGPQFVAVDQAGNVYPTDAALDHVQRFTADGKLLGSRPRSSSPGGFGPPPRKKDGVAVTGSPISLCVDRQNQVSVAPPQTEQFTNDGKYLRGIGGEGTAPGQFHFRTPRPELPNGRLYVVDTMNGRI